MTFHKCENLKNKHKNFQKSANEQKQILKKLSNMFLHN